jgi:hypothetical protein
MHTVIAGYMGGKNAYAVILCEIKMKRTEFKLN